MNRAQKIIEDYKSTEKETENSSETSAEDTSVTEQQVVVKDNPHNVTTEQTGASIQSTINLKTDKKNTLNLDNIPETQNLDPNTVQSVIPLRTRF